MSATKSPPTSPPRTSLGRAGSVAPATPEKHKPKAGTPAPATPPAASRSVASPRAASAAPEKKPVDDKEAPQEEEAGEIATIPAPQEKLDIDESVFSQITEMDDDDPDCEFSREIVVDYFKQASTTFAELREALRTKDLATLSAKGHFLKGSSAALGVKKVQESCEHVQHYGALRDEIEGVDLTQEQALARVALIMPRLEGDYKLAEQWLRDYYLKLGIDLEDNDE